MIEQELKQYKEKLRFKVHDFFEFLYRDHKNGFVLASEATSVKLGVCTGAMFLESKKRTEPKVLNEYLK